ncbi:MAG: CHAD domain-containing protein [Caldilineaceae bacterium]|nr:CHAD domain-containing protein [Caldilineaceae bacterium]
MPIPTQSTLDREIEAKYQTDGSALIDQLSSAAELASGYPLGKLECKDVQDIYLDTPDFGLLRRGYQLRVRRQGTERLATLKGRQLTRAPAIADRLEIEEPLLDDEMPAALADLPAPIAQQLVELLASSEPLHTLCVLNQRRRLRLVSSGDAALGSDRSIIGELSLDAIQIRQDLAGPVLGHNYAVEIELAPGADQAELETLAATFQATHALTPVAGNKLDHALSLISCFEPGAPLPQQGIRPDMHMAEACRLIWRSQLVQILINEAGVRNSDDPEYVHDMRVAIRRIRAAARLYGGYFKQKAIRVFLKRMRHTAKVLGAVRDLDVAIVKLRRYCKKASKHQQAALLHTVEVWQAQRAEAHKKLVAWLDDKRYKRFLADFAAFCAAPGAGVAGFAPVPGEELTPFQVRHVTPPMIIGSYARVRGYESYFEQGETPATESLHMLRIECKYLRYNLEFVANLLGPEAKRLVADLRWLQDVLGDVNDAVVSKQMVAASGIGGAAISRYEKAQDKIVRKLLGRVSKHYGAFVLPETRRRLMQAVGHI